MKLEELHYQMKVSEYGNLYGNEHMPYFGPGDDEEEEDDDDFDFPPLDPDDIDGSAAYDEALEEVEREAELEFEN